MSSAISSTNQLIGSIYTARQQRKEAERQRVEEARRREPFEKVATEVSKRLRSLDTLFDNAPLLQQSLKTMEGYLQPGALAEAGGQFATDYLESTQDVADIDSERMQSDLVNRFGAQFGNRVGSELPEAAGRAGAEFLTRRHGEAQGLVLPAANLLSSLPLQYGQFDMSRIMDPLTLASNFATYNPSAPSLGTAATRTGAGLIGAGSITGSGGFQNWMQRAPWNQGTTYQSPYDTNSQPSREMFGSPTTSGGGSDDSGWQSWMWS